MVHPGNVYVRFFKRKFIESKDAYLFVSLYRGYDTRFIHFRFTHDTGMSNLHNANNAYIYNRE